MSEEIPNVDYLSIVPQRGLAEAESRSMGTLSIAVGSLLLGTTWHLWQIYPAFVLLGIGFAYLGHVMLGKIIPP